VDLARVSPRLVGREGVLDVLASVAARSREGRAARACLVGPAGAGRSAVLARAARDAALAGAVPLLVSPDASGRGLVEAVLERAAALPHGEHCARALARLDAATRGHGSHPAALLAAAEALGLVASHTPLWIGLDDLDLAHDEARRALAFLARGESPITWIASAAAPQPALGEETEVVPLPPLPLAAVTAMLASLLPDLVELEALAAAAHAHGVGLPRRICAGVCELQRAGALRIISGRWRLAADDARLASAFAYDDATEAARAVAGLAPAHRAVLALAALAEASTTVDQLTRLADASASAVTAALQAGRDAGLLRPGRYGLEIASPSAREALAATLTAAEAREAHARALALLDGAIDPEARAARAHHAAALGQHARAAVEWLAAAEGATAAGSYRLAATWYARARAAGAHGPQAALGHGDALARAGDLEGALAAYDDAATAGAPPAVVALRRGRALSRAGRYADAVAALVDAGDAGEARFVRAWSLVHLGRYDEAAPLLAPRPGDGPADRARLARAEATLLRHRGQPAAGRARLEEALALAAEAGDRALHAEIELTLATVLWQCGDLEGAAKRYRTTIAEFRRSGDTGMLARALNNLAIASYQAGRWDEARTGWEAYADLAARLDDAGERVLAANNLGMLWKDRGELVRAVGAFERAAAGAAAAGLRRYEAMARGNLAEALLLAGELSRAQEALDASEALARALDARDELSECARRRAALSLARGDARTALEQACEAAAMAGALGASLEQGHALLVGAAAARTAGDVGTAGALLGEARRAFAASGTRLEQARADLEEAEIALAAGRGGDARALAGRAVQVFAELGAARELASARALERGAGGARSDVALELATAVAGAGTAAEMLERVLERLLALTGAERGFVVLLEGDAGPRLAAARTTCEGDAPMPRLSAGIAERVIASRRPLVLADVGEHAELAARASVVALGLRAALAAPLMLGERCLGLLYVDSRRNPADLARWGLWPLEAAAAIVAPSLDALLAREREHERALALRETAERLLEAMPTIDAALELVAEEADAARRVALARRARARCAALVAQADAVLEILRDDPERDAPPARGVDVDAVVRYALAEMVGSDAAALVAVQCAPGLPRVQADAVALARVLSQLVELATAGRTRPVRLRALACDDDGRGAVLGWRPGQGSNRTRVHLVVEPSRAGDSLPLPALPGPVAMRTARRALAAWGAGLWVERDDQSPGRIVVDLAPVAPSAAEARQAS
jgi:hypothetical protein